MTPEDLLTYLASHGYQTTTITHPPLFTVADSQILRDKLPGAHCKNLFLKDERGALFLLIALQDTTITMNQLHKRIGSKRLSFGKPDLLMDVLGVTPGSVSPFALIHDTNRLITVLLDKAMLAYEQLNYHPLNNSMTTTISRQDLLHFLDKQGYQPQIIALE